jgi:hypothetical protein
VKEVRTHGTLIKRRPLKRNRVFTVEKLDIGDQLENSIRNNLRRLTQQSGASVGSAWTASVGSAWTAYVGSAWTASVGSVWTASVGSVWTAYVGSAWTASVGSVWTASELLRNSSVYHYCFSRN